MIKRLKVHIKVGVRLYPNKYKEQKNIFQVIDINKEIFILQPVEEKKLFLFHLLWVNPKILYLRPQFWF